MNFKSFDWKGKESFAFEDFAKGSERFGDWKCICYVKKACNIFLNSILHKRPFWQMGQGKTHSDLFTLDDPDSSIEVYWNSSKYSRALNSQMMFGLCRHFEQNWSKRRVTGVASAAETGVIFWKKSSSRCETKRKIQHQHQSSSGDVQGQGLFADRFFPATSYATQTWPKRALILQHQISYHQHCAESSTLFGDRSFTFTYLLYIVHLVLAYVGNTNQL